MIRKEARLLVARNSSRLTDSVLCQCYSETCSGMDSRKSRLRIVLLLAAARAVLARVENSKFPDDFFFGAATSAMQIEGAWNVDGRGPSVWDTFTHEYPEKIADGRNTNDTAHSYYFYEDDIKALKSVGVSDKNISPCFDSLNWLHLTCR